MKEVEVMAVVGNEPEENNTPIGNTSSSSDKTIKVESCVAKLVESKGFAIVNHSDITDDA